MLSSDIVSLNRKLVKTAYDFKKFFHQLVDLKPEKEYDYINGSSNFKLGGVMILPPINIKYYLRIVCRPDNKASF